MYLLCFLSIFLKVKMFVDEEHDITIICHLEAYMHASVPRGK